MQVQIDAMIRKGIIERPKLPRDSLCQTFFVDPRKMGQCGSFSI